MPYKYKAKRQVRGGKPSSIAGRHAPKTRASGRKNYIGGRNEEEANFIWGQFALKNQDTTTT